MPQSNALWRQIFTKPMLMCMFTGFASGFPYYVLAQLIQLWLATEEVSLANIGFFALVGLPYSWKFLWAPLLDRYFNAELGRRKSWLLPTQILLLLSICSLGLFSPADSFSTVLVLCLFIAFLSATQDIALDAYRRELLKDNELGLGSSIHVQMWRIAGFIPGSLSFVLADIYSWPVVFMITGSFMLICIAFTLTIKEPEITAVPKSNLQQSFINPFKDFLQSHGFRMTVGILLFMFLYKLGDSMATALSTKFYLDLGFSATEIGIVAKNAALWPAIIGGLLGGILMLKIGINRALWLFGVVQLVTILGFVLLAEAGNNLLIFSLVIALEYLGVGLGTAAFTAFIARATNPQFAATQFALLTAFAVFPRTIASSLTGVIVEQVGWTPFFLICTALAIPGMLMLFWVAPWNAVKAKNNTWR